MLMNNKVQKIIQLNEQDRENLIKFHENSISEMKQHHSQLAKKLDEKDLANNQILNSLED